MSSAKKGFSLLELLIVFAIIGMLSAIAFAALEQSRVHARDASRAAQVQEFIKAFELYYTENGSYPTDGIADPGGAIEFTATSSPATQLLTGGFIKTIPSDPRYTVADGYHYCASDDGTSIALLIHVEDDAGNSGYCETGRGTLRAAASLCTVDDPVLGADTTIDLLDACETRI